MKPQWITAEQTKVTVCPQIPQISIKETDNKMFALINHVPTGKPDFHSFLFPSLPQAKQFVENNPAYFAWGHR